MSDRQVRSSAWWRRCFIAALTGSTGNPQLNQDAFTIVSHAREVADEAYARTPRRAKREPAAAPPGGQGEPASNPKDPTP